MSRVILYIGLHINKYVGYTCVIHCIKIKNCVMVIWAYNFSSGPTTFWSCRPWCPATVLAKMLTLIETKCSFSCLQIHELIQVECYQRCEGVLVRYWYPVDMLERPPAGYRKSPTVGHQALSTANIHLHRYFNSSYCRLFTDPTFP